MLIHSDYANNCMVVHRYVAYTSDIGEAFRPVVPPWLVTAAYGVSWAYVAGCAHFHPNLSSRVLIRTIPIET